MRVLFLTYHYPPDPAVGAIRAGNIVRELEGRGHEVVVIATGQGYGEVEQVHRIRPLPNATQFYRKSRRDGGDRRKKGTGSSVAKRNRPLPFWKRAALSLLLLPDEHQGYVWPAVRLGRRLARSPFDLVVTSAPPHSVTVSGLLLKHLTGLPWVAELRDPWTDNAIRPPYHTALRARILDLLEARSLKLADLVVPVTGATADLLRRRVRHAAKVQLVRNGVPEWTAPARPTGSGPFRIVHTGTLYGSRDPRPLMAAIAALRRRGSVRLPESIHLELVGNCASYEPLIRQAAEQLPPPDRVVLHGSVGQEESARMMASADLLLLLAQNQPLQVPQKLYDYLASRRPVLAFVDREGESAEMLRSVGGHFLVHDATTPEIEARLEAAIDSRNEPFETDEARIASWSVPVQMRRLADAMEAVAAGAR